VLCKIKYPVTSTVEVVYGTLFQVADISYMFVIKTIKFDDIDCEDDLWMQFLAVLPSLLSVFMVSNVASNAKGSVIGISLSV